MKKLLSVTGSFLLVASIIWGTSALSENKELSALETRMTAQLQEEVSKQAEIDKQKEILSTMEFGLAIARTKTFQTNCELIQEKKKLSLPIQDARIIELCQKSDLNEYNRITGKVFP